ncbi:MAG TPA: cation diffusion facilitator family transporter [Pirellulales bacterium]|nr:cation diffusion facilitator family transporter [Pirellulales bacterium]
MADPPNHFDAESRSWKAAQLGLLVNAALIVIKLLAGVVGHAYALIADAAESSIDVVASLVVMRGLQLTTRAPDPKYPYGYGRAEPLAAAVVSLMLVGAAAGIAIVAVRGIVTPHQSPAPFTLVVLAAVIVAKEWVFRKVVRAGRDTGSTAIQADAWHHRSDAITSTAAFIGIAVAIWGGPGWESADDWGALVAAFIIAFNGARMLRPSIHDLMDRSPDAGFLSQIQQAALATAGVERIEKLRVRKFSLAYFVDLHVQAEPAMTLIDAHILSGKVKSAIRQAVPAVVDVLVHMEPFVETAEARPHS